MRNALRLVALFAAIGPAAAQTSPPNALTNPSAPVGPPSAVSPPEQIAPPAGSMSDRLSQQRGTITPPNVDPGMTVAPSQSGRTSPAVIPPPGSPGGNQSVIPK